MGRMPATATFSYGQRGKRADLSELLHVQPGAAGLFKVMEEILRVLPELRGALLDQDNNYGKTSRIF